MLSDERLQARVEALEFLVAMLLARTYEQDALLARHHQIQRRYASGDASPYYPGGYDDVRWAALQVQAILFVLQRAIARHENREQLQEDDLISPPL